MPMIHPTAVISRDAQIGQDAEIGPYAVIEGPVTIGRRVRILAHAYLVGHTRIGDDCVIHPFAAIGGPPQDYAHTGQRSYCVVGDRTVIREGVTIHRATDPEATTEVGEDCMLMAYCHIAHDCRVDHHVVMTNAALLAGHVQVGHHTVFGGLAAVHQFVRIGEMAMIGGRATLTQDAAPFMTFTERNRCIGINRVGLRRRDVPSQDIDELRHLHRQVFRSAKPLRQAVHNVADQVHTASGRRLVEFLLAGSKRGIAGQRPTPANATMEKD